MANRADGTWGWREKKSVSARSSLEGSEGTRSRSLRSLLGSHWASRIRFGLKLKNTRQQNWNQLCGFARSTQRGVGQAVEKLTLTGVNLLGASKGSCLELVNLLVYLFNACFSLFSPLSPLCTIPNSISEERGRLVTSPHSWRVPRRMHGHCESPGLCKASKELLRTACLTPERNGLSPKYEHRATKA